MPKFEKGSKEAKEYMQNLRSLKKGGSSNNNGYDEMKENSLNPRASLNVVNQTNEENDRALRDIYNNLNRVAIEGHTFSPREIRVLIQQINNAFDTIDERLLDGEQGRRYERFQNELLNIENRYPTQGIPESKNNGRGLIQTKSKQKNRNQNSDIGLGLSHPTRVAPLPNNTIVVNDATRYTLGDRLNSLNRRDNVIDLTNAERIRNPRITDGLIRTLNRRIRPVNLSNLPVTDTSVDVQTPIYSRRYYNNVIRPDPIATPIGTGIKKIKIKKKN